MHPEYTELVYLEAGDYVTGTLDWSDGSDFDFLLIDAADPYDFDSCIFDAAAATGSKPEHFEGYIPYTGWFELVVEWYEGPGTDVEFTMFFAILYDEIYTNSVAAGELMEVDMTAIGTATDGVYLVTTTSAGWNFDHTINTRFVYDTTDPTISTEAVDATIDLNKTMDFMWEISDLNGGTYEVFLDGVSVADGEFTGDYNVSYTFDPSVNGTFVIELEVTDAAGHEVSDEVTITVNAEYVEPTTEPPKPGIAGFGFMSLAVFSAAALMVLRKKIRK